LRLAALDRHGAPFGDSDADCACGACRFALGRRGGEAAMSTNLILYSREYCHLCHDMLAALDELRGEFDFALEVIDIDADPALEAKYNELVPVLEADGLELCRYFLDGAKVREYLSGHP
jgi:hypothetical protein